MLGAWFLFSAGAFLCAIAVKWIYEDNRDRSLRMTPGWKRVDLPEHEKASRKYS